MPGSFPTFEKILTLDKAIAYARGLQEAYCQYGTKDGDNRPCDCKYFVGWSEPKSIPRGEQTGCPEARALIEYLENQKQLEEKYNIKLLPKCGCHDDPRDESHFCDEHRYARLDEADD